MQQWKRKLYMHSTFCTMCICIYMVSVSISPLIKEHPTTKNFPFNFDITISPPRTPKLPRIQTPLQTIMTRIKTCFSHKNNHHSINLWMKRIHDILRTVYGCIIYIVHYKWQQKHTENPLSTHVVLIYLTMPNQPIINHHNLVNF